MLSKIQTAEQEKEIFFVEILNELKLDRKYIVEIGKDKYRVTRCDTTNLYCTYFLNILFGQIWKTTLVKEKEP